MCTLILGVPANLFCFIRYQILYLSNTIYLLTSFNFGTSFSPSMTSPVSICSVTTTSLLDWSTVDVMCTEILWRFGASWAIRSCKRSRWCLLTCRISELKICAWPAPMHHRNYIHYGLPHSLVRASLVKDVCIWKRRKSANKVHAEENGTYM